MSDINELIESGSVPLATPRKSKADLSPEPISEIPEMADERPEVPDAPEVPEHDDSSSESSVEEQQEGSFLFNLRIKKESFH